MEEDGKTKFKRRTRPEPLIIPPPKPSTFIPPSVYSSITHYQSNLRSPVRLPDNLHALPPYTPPPILSPVRGGTGLYFSTFLTNIAVSNQILPPPATPNRINIGQQYQAEIPDLQDQPSSQMDQHKADLCVEFYYTYKKQVKVGRNGILTFGPPDSPVENHSEAVVDVKTGTVLVIKEPDPVSKEAHHSSVPHRPRAEAAVKKTKAPTKPPQDPNEVFPCKKCGR
ncbi:hypothetical protein GOODEAATRI_003100 [Goodea atripinnis]|uniref:ELM2 domain-containing protein n=1 Tax=Goodea atripinnis TaxID=208336 RepID=A0ABV0MYB1_9TELE